MRRNVVGVVAAACIAVSTGLSACDDEQPGPLAGGEAGDAGEGASGGRGGSGGAGGSEGGGEAGAPGVGGTGQGGEPGGGRGGGGGIGGTSSGGSAQGGDAGSAGGNEGGSGGAGGDPDQLTICLRLTGPGSLAIDTARAYERALVDDCRVNWTTILYFDPSIDLNVRDVFLNNLVVWNLELWGCNPIAPSEFSLIYEPAPLTSADAQALIDIYVQVATTELSMSPLEIEEMRALLGRLSQPVIDRVSDEYSNPDCAGGAGGGSG